MLLFICILQNQYHVTFFDDKVSRAWVNSTSIRKFTGGKEDDEMVHKFIWNNKFKAEQTISEYTTKLRYFTLAMKQN
jgi:hypothetical protein